MTPRRTLRHCSTAVGLFAAGLLATFSYPTLSSTAFGQPAPMPATATAHSAVRLRLDKLTELSGWVKQHGGTLSAYFLDLETGQETGVNESTPLNPASNMKIVTAVLALDKRGAHYSYRTAVHGRIGGDGTAKQLVLHGDGDPSLTEADLWRLANGLAGRGLKRVETLLVDQTAFDDQFIPPAFEQQPDEWASFRAPVSAIAIERNTVTLNVLPQAPGSSAHAWFEPRGAARLSGTIASVAPGKGQNIQLNLTPDKGGGLTAKIDGHIAAGLGRQRFSKRVEDPRLVPGLALSAALKAFGISVTNVSLGSVGDLPRLTYIASAPLEQLLAPVGKQSDNFTAEMIFKSLGTQGANPATTSASADIATRWLAGITALPQGTKILNGSGLFDANRLSARTLGEVLRFAYREPTLRHAVLSQLAVGGTDGTLTRRFQQTRGQVRAKTGTLNAALALSGYLLRDGTKAPMVFSVLVNGIAGRHGEVRNRIDKVVTQALLR